MYNPWAWDRMSLVAGVAALLCTIIAFMLDYFGVLWTLQWGATLVSLLTGLIGWRNGRRRPIVLGIGCAALSWLPYTGLFASCFLSSDCL